ncbi:MAG: Uma2 family endonuclease [Myxococcaceae bacterium]
MSWDDFDALLALRGDQAGVRICYLEGELELMTPSRQHEKRKARISGLLEAWAVETDTILEALGSWTLRSGPSERGVEPDACYVLGHREPEVPDLAIEVEWTAGGLDKLEIYRGLGVREVWILGRESLQVFTLTGGGYQLSERSVLLPDLDIELMSRFVDHPTQTEAVRGFLAALRKS